MWHYCLFFSICLGASVVDPRLVDFLADQNVRDVQFAQFRINPHNIRESTPMGNFTLKTMLHNGMYSTVFTVHESRKYLIKYQCNCDQTSDIHRLLTDSWFTNISHELGMSPKIFFVSPPVALSSKRTRKFNFTMSNRRWTKCLADGGTVRFAVMQRIHGLTLNQFRDQHSPLGIPLFRGVSVLGILIEFLETLHSHGIVHGDIHGGNILLAKDSEGATTIKLIDFGLAFFDSAERSNNATHPFGYWTHELTTPWQIRGLPWGKRDDIYKAFDLCARLINGDQWGEYVAGLVEAGTDQLLEFRYKDTLMDIPDALRSASESPFEPDVLQVSAGTAESIRTRFSRIIRRILSLEDVNTEPPYAFILGELESIQRILNPEFFVDTNRS